MLRRLGEPRDENPLLIGGDKFAERFGHLFEHSPWVVERAAAHVPFADAASLHAAFMKEVANATPEEQMSLIRAHPELGVKSVPLTQASDAEQKGAGLKALTEQEFADFAALNKSYQAKFGFPFIICVRMHSKSKIFAILRHRLRNAPEIEHAQALFEIGHIARLRLEDALAAP
jgi:2-oxo-4-hydroxy-4-carboxy-5-ureidoimidazoline decarboxylase